MTTSFTLTMLGTDTNYTPEPNETYPRGETLSLISTEIKTDSAETAPKGVLQYKTDNVVVVKGPSTLGSDVNDRIAQGVAAALLAFSKTPHTNQEDPITLNVIGHSRGAVESVLIAHELDTIKTFFVANPNATYADLKKYHSDEENTRYIKKDNNTGAISGSLFNRFAIDEMSFGYLKEKIKNLKINLFAIDPVPGDPGLGVTWFDKRFTSLPEIVCDAQIYYYQNEKTYLGFTPLHIKPFNETQRVEWHTLPGHHGTGSAGNNKNQQDKVIAKKTHHVQQLLLLKIREFLSKHNTVFNSSTGFYKDYKKETKGKRPKAKEGIGGKNVHIENDIIDYSKSYRVIYSKIRDYKPGYEAYNDGNYLGCGNLQNRSIITGINEKNGFLYANLLDVLGETQDYINEDHRGLMRDYFLNKLGITENMGNVSLDELVNQASAAIQKLIKNDSSEEFTIVDDDSSSDEFDLGDTSSTNSLRVRPENQETFSSASIMLVETIEKPAAKKDISKHFVDLLKIIGEKYLNTDWTSQEQAKEKFFIAIKTMLGQFKAISTSTDDTSDRKMRFKELLEQCHLHLISTIKSQSDILQDHTNQLQSWPDEELKAFLRVECKNELPELERLFESDDYKTAIFNSTEERIRHLLKTETELNYKELAAQFDKRFESKFKDHDTLYTQLNVFLQDIAGLIHLDDHAFNSIKEYGYDVHKNIDTLIDFTAKRFSNDPKLLDTIPKRSDVFHQKVLQHAIAHYKVMDPIKEKLNAPKETHFSTLLDKLILKAQAYRDHLISQKVEKNNPKLKAIETLLDGMSDITEDADEPKFFLPSERVKRFYTQLNGYEDTLKEHRDSGWMRFAKDAIVAGGILISGILPGLIVLAIYSQLVPRRSLAFWQPQSRVLLNEFKEDMPEMTI